MGRGEALGGWLYRGERVARWHGAGDGKGATATSLSPYEGDILILSSWSIWMIRNNKIFRDERSTFERWKSIYLSELNWLKFRIKAKQSEQFKSWLETQL